MMIKPVFFKGFISRCCADIYCWGIMLTIIVVGKCVCLCVSVCVCVCVCLGVCVCVCLSVGV